MSNGAARPVRRRSRSPTARAPCAARPGGENGEVAGDVLAGWDACGIDLRRAAAPESARDVRRPLQVDLSRRHAGLPFRTRLRGRRMRRGGGRRRVPCGAEDGSRSRRRGARPRHRRLVRRAWALRRSYLHERELLVRLAGRLPRTREVGGGSDRPPAVHATSAHQRLGVRSSPRQSPAGIRRTGIACRGRKILESQAACRRPLVP
jgi:hypothetical protein